MAVSPITLVSEEGIATSLSTFIRNGALYLAWTIPAGNIYGIRWKKHTDGFFTEVVGAVGDAYKNISTAYDPESDAVVVAFSDAPEAAIYVTRFDATTGAVLNGPTLAAHGRTPSLVYRGNTVGKSLELVYSSATRGGVYLVETLDGGVSWSGERPVLNNYVLNTRSLAVAAFDDEHLSILQIGTDARQLREITSYSRTRPVSGIVKHPTVPNQYFLSEPSWIDSTYLTNYFRGAIRVSPDGTNLYRSDGVRLGSSDGLNELVLMDVSKVLVQVGGSWTNGTADVGVGDNITEFDMTPCVPRRAVDCFGTGTGPVIVDFDLSNSYIYVAGTKEVAPTTNGGALDIIRRSDFARFQVVAPNSTMFFHAVGVGIPPEESGGVPVIFVAVTDNGVEKLRIYTENSYTPVFVKDHKMPSYVNKLLVRMESDSSGLVYVCHSDRLNVYRFDGLNAPIRLTMTIPVIGIGTFYQAVVASNGNVICAMGLGGVGVFSPTGALISQALASGIPAQPWSSKTWALNDLVIPTEKNIFAPQRIYFRCTQAGTSGGMEPFWGPSGTIVDGSARWVAAGTTGATITGVVIDETRERIYAVGVLGGPTGTIGKFYVFDAPGLIPGFLDQDTPVHVPAGGSYNYPKDVVFYCNVPNAGIFYTTDGSYPTLNSTLFTDPIPLHAEGTTQIRAVAYVNGRQASDASDQTYVLQFETLPAPTVSPDGGAFETAPSVSISCSEPDVQIYYTMDGTDPTESSTLYSGPFLGPTDGVVKARAYKFGWRSSPVTSSYFMAYIKSGLAFYVDAAEPASYSGSGTKWNDLKGTYNNVNLVGGVLYTTEAEGSFSFDGTDDYADCGTVFSELMDGTLPHSIEFWIKSDAVQMQYADIWGNHGGTGKGAVAQNALANSNTYGAAWGNSTTWTGYGTFTVNAGVWQHVVLTKESAALCKAYVDGVLVDTVTTGSGNQSMASGMNFCLGRGYQPGGRYWKGKMGLFRIYNRALSQKEVQQNWNGGQIRFFGAKVATPVIVPSGYSTKEPTVPNVSISCGTDGASIFYTTDGSTPTKNSTPYTYPFTAPVPSTVKAIAFKTGMNPSFVSSVTYTNGIVTDGLTFQVDFDDPLSYPGSGTIVKDLIGGASLALNGSTYAANPGQVTFNGSSNYIDTGKTAAQLGMYDASHSILLAFKAPTAASVCYILGTSTGTTRQGLHVGSGSNTKFYLAHYADDVTGGIVRAGEWNIFQGVYDKTAGKGYIYINGVLIASGTQASFIGTTNVWIARSFAGYSVGSLALAAIYNRALTTEEIYNNYDAIRSRFNLPERGLLLDVDPYSTPFTPLVEGDVFDVEYLVVGGGGGGAYGRGGGGGGGGFLTGTTQVTGPVAVVVGKGGGPEVNGGNSSFGDIVAIGGGAGFSLGTSGAAGGSGGGAGGNYLNVQPLGGAGTAGQGYAGGSSPGLYDNPRNSGGGGGAGGPGIGGVGSSSTGTLPAGGPGLASTISGMLTPYAGGGGGGGCNNDRSGVGPGPGGWGGGGNGGTATGTIIAPTNGVDGTGGGGGGGGVSGVAWGGSGIVIVRYAGNARASGGVITSSGGYTIHTFQTKLPGTITLQNGAVVDPVEGFGSISLDGVNDYVSCPLTGMCPAETTFEMWVKRPAASTGYILAITNGAADPEIRLAFHANEKFWAIVYDVSAYQAQLYSQDVTLPNTWYHVVLSVTNGANGVNLYVNGQLQASGGNAYNGHTSENATEHTLGTYNTPSTGYGGYAKVKIAQYRVYKRALSASEVSERFNRFKSRFGL